MFYLLNLSMNLLLRRALLAQNSENNQKTQRTRGECVVFILRKKVVISKNLVFLINDIMFPIQCLI